MATRVNPQVSVVIPTCRRAALLRRALASVRRQTFRNYETVVVVDGRDDDTMSVLSEPDNSDLRTVINEPPQGGAEARNIGVRAATGKYISFLDDDDEFLPQKLQLQFELSEASPHRFPIGYCRVVWRTPKKDFILPRRAKQADESIAEYLFCRSSLTHGEGLISTDALFAPRALLSEVPFTKGLKRHHEWDWLLRVADRADTGFEFCDQPLATCYVEEQRVGISESRGWQVSFDWLQSRRELISDRAYASFLMTVVSSLAAKEGDWKQFLALTREAFQNGSPRAIDVLIHLGIWAVPQGLRRSLRGFAAMAGGRS